ncbi:MAG: hypothetical protein Q9173_004917 [Seirophora scorigena]
MAYTVVSSSDHGDSTWQLVNFQKLGRTGKHAAQDPSIRHRRGHPDAAKRLSMFKMRSRSNASSGHGPSPSLSTDSQSAGRDDTEEARLESGWSDSDHSDSPTKSWVAKGSRMLKKQNSKFSLSSSRRSTWVEESDEACEQHPGLPLRGSNRHGRISSTGSGPPVRPSISISRPYNFQHLAHTQAHQFTDLHSASQHKLISDFSAIRASQEPQLVLQGIPTEDVRSPSIQPSRPASREPITPPSLSPNRNRTPGTTRPSPIRLPETLSRSRSIDNFSQPSPRTYRTPPATPPARTSPWHATPFAPDFLSEVHHATPEERELLWQRSNPDNIIKLTHAPALHHQLDDPSIPHAITTPNDIALTLQPSPVRRSTLLLADVPEEDELRSIKRISENSIRPVTADSILRHATSFPSTGYSPRRRRTSRLSGVLPVGGLHSRGSVASLGDAEESMCSRISQRISTEVKSIDPCWEEYIDYCYQHEAEADCDFDWDRVSMVATFPSCTSPKVEAHPQAWSQTSGKLDLPVFVRANSANHLPPLQTSLPELSHSATSSAKSSTASLRGPHAPLQQLPSPQKITPALQTSKSADALNIYLSRNFNMPWAHEDPSPKARSWDHATHFNYPFNNLRLSGSSRPTPSMSRSSENVMRPASSSTAQSHRNTNSSGSLLELVHSRNYRQQADRVAEPVTEPVTDRIAIPSATKAHNIAEHSQSQPTTSKNVILRSILKKDFTDSGTTFQISGQTSEPSTQPGPTDQSISVAASASKLRSSSIASSSSGSSSRWEIQDLNVLPERKVAKYLETRHKDLLSLQWPSPPRNVLLVQKRNAAVTIAALKDFAQHIHDTFPDTNILLEPDTADELHQSIPFPVYTSVAPQDAASKQAALTQKVDLAATFGGDGTILRASSLFSSALSVPPMLSFSMGTLGFLGEWKLAEYKRAFREVYMSGAGAGDRSQILETSSSLDGKNIQPESAGDVASTAGGGPAGWSSIRGKSLGKTRGARILLRHRLKVTVKVSEDESGRGATRATDTPTIHAVNEIIIHRGATPHLAHIAIFIGGRFLTEAVADGMIISTPTGSTAYSLSSGGSIIHPLVDSLCLTPICPRSLSFRPLILPASTPVTLRLSEKNRGREVDISIDGARQHKGLKVGGEIRVVGEEIQRDIDGWRGGVPCVMRGGGHFVAPPRAPSPYNIQSMPHLGAGTAGPAAEPHPAGRVKHGLFIQAVRLLATLSWTLLVLCTINATQSLGCPLYVINKDYYYAYMALTKQSFGIFIITITQWFSPTVIRISGHASVRDQLLQTRNGRLETRFPERLVMIANHQLYSDWLYLWWIAYTSRMHGHVFIVLKESLKYIPVIGPGMMFYGFVFMARNWVKDRPRLQHRLRKLAQSRHGGPMSGEQGKQSLDPMWLMIYPEGTNLSGNTRKGSKRWADKQGIRDFEHVLIPKSTGLLYCLQELKGSVEWVYDCTVGYEGIPRGAYGQDIFTLRSTYFQGRPPKSVNMYWRRFPVSSIPLPSSSDPSPQEAGAFGNWLHARWQEKEALLEHFARNGRFPADDGHDSEDAPSVGMSKGAGFIETQVQLTHWYEILQVFSVLGAFAAVMLMLNKTWRLGSTVAWGDGTK